MTQARLNAMQLAPEAYTVLRNVEQYIRQTGLEPALLHLVKMRASQINGCAFCLDMHSRDARAHGETEQRLYLLNAWREVGLYSERERAALAWTECLTLVASRGAPDAEYEALARSFTPLEIVNLTTAVGMINLWNRLMIGLHVQPAAQHHATAAAKAA